MCCVESKSTVYFWGRGEAGVEDVTVDAGGDAGPEEVAFCADDALLCSLDAFFRLGEGFPGLPALDEHRSIPGYICGGPYVIEA